MAVGRRPPRRLRLALLAAALLALGGAAAPARATLANGLDDLCRRPELKARQGCLDLISRHQLSSEPVLALLRELSLNDVDPDIRERAALLYLQLRDLPPDGRLYDPDARTRRPARATAAPPAAAPTPPPKTPADLEAEARADRDRSILEAGDPTRVVFAPTAFLRPVDSYTLNFYEFGSAFLDIGVDEHVQIGLQTTVPIGFLVFGGSARFAYALPSVGFGVQTSALAVQPFFDENEPLIYILSAGPIVTVGTPDSFMNAGALFVYGGVTEDPDDAISILIPHLGGSVRVAHGFRISAEVYGFQFLDNGVRGPDFGELFVVLWGVRWFSADFWFDVAFIDPICDECDEIYETLVIGIPLLNLGTSW